MYVSGRFVSSPGGLPLVDGPRRLGFGEAADRAARLGTLFHSLGLVPGDRVALAVRDDLDAAALVLGCLRAGLAMLPIDPGGTPDEVRALLGSGRPHVAFVDQDLLSTLGPEVFAGNPACRFFPVVVLAKPRLIDRLLGGRRPVPGSTTYPACLDDNAPIATPAVLPAPDAAALLLPTSGTTATPRLVCWSRDNLGSQLRLLIEQLRLDASARVLNLLPFLYGDGLMMGLPMTLCAGATLVRLPEFTIARTQEVIDAVYRYRATHLVLVPSLLQLLLQLGGDLREVLEQEDFRFVVSTGAPLPADLWARFEEISGRRVVNVYGLTEGGNLFFAGPDDESHGIGTVGRPLRCEVRLVDETGADVPDEKPGELLLRGPIVPAGYFGAPPRPRKAWLATGDLLQRGTAGHYQVVGRKKSVIIVGGRNVLPDEVDQALRSCPLVADSITVSEPDEVWGERVVSYAVPRNPGAPQDAPEQVRAVLAHVGALLSPYKLPRRLIFVAELPRGPAGKVRLDELARIARAKASAPGAAGPVDVAAEVQALAAACFRLPENELNDAVAPGRTRGWDSLAHLDFASGLEHRFGIQLSPKDIMAIDSLGAAVRIVRQRLS